MISLPRSGFVGFLSAFETGEDLEEGSLHTAGQSVSKGACVKL